METMTRERYLDGRSKLTSSPSKIPQFEGRSANTLEEWDALAEASGLDLAPIRAELEQQEADARAAMEAMPFDEKMSMELRFKVTDTEEYKQEVAAIEKRLAELEGDAALGILGLHALQNAIRETLELGEGGVLIPKVEALAAESPIRTILEGNDLVTPLSVEEVERLEKLVVRVTIDPAEVTDEGTTRTEATEKPPAAAKPAAKKGAVKGGRNS